MRLLLVMAELLVYRADYPNSNNSDNPDNSDTSKKTITP